MQLSEQQLTDLRTISELGPELLAKVANALNGLTPPPIRPEMLLESIKTHLAEQATAAECLSRQAIAFNGLLRQTNLSARDVVDGIGHAIDDVFPDDTQFARSWSLIAPSFQDVISSPAVRLPANAIALSYDYANLYRQVRILTDVRPLFNEAGDSIEGAVISFTLRLRFDNVEGDHDISIAMDERDVKQLKDQCERSLTKAVTARQAMANGLNLPTFVTGERKSVPTND